MVNLEQIEILERELQWKMVEALSVKMDLTLLNLALAWVNLTNFLYPVICLVCYSLWGTDSAGSEKSFRVAVVVNLSCQLKELCGRQSSGHVFVRVTEQEKSGQVSVWVTSLPGLGSWTELRHLSFLTFNAMWPAVSSSCCSDCFTLIDCSSNCERKQALPKLLLLALSQQLACQ